jgi:hypothetical protein
MAFEYTKQPWEEEIIGVDFSRRVPTGITIMPVATGITEVSIEETVSPSGSIAANYGGHLVLGTPVLTGVVGKEKILAVMISAGVSGFKYRVSFRVTLSDGQKKEDDVWVIVKES